MPPPIQEEPHRQQQGCHPGTILKERKCHHGAFIATKKHNRYTLVPCPAQWVPQAAAWFEQAHEAVTARRYEYRIPMVDGAWCTANPEYVLVLFVVAECHNLPTSGGTLAPSKIQQSVEFMMVGLHRRGTGHNT